MKHGLQLDKLVLSQAGKPLVSLDISIASGEVVTIMGPSGSGKSTLLAALIGALPAEFSQAGRIILDGMDVTDVPTRMRKIGILFQDDILFPHLCVAQNLAFGLDASIKGRAARQARVEAALADAELPGFGDRDPATLSGGERARIALMRMLLSAPCALLLDEPFSRLDAALRAQIRQFVLDRARRMGLPILLVTHDMEDALAAGGRILSPLGVPLAGD